MNRPPFGGTLRFARRAPDLSQCVNRLTRRIHACADIELPIWGDGILEAKMIKAGTVVAALSVSLFSIPAHAQCTFPFDRQIFGEYRGDDGGTYHMRQIGEDVWRVGLSGDDGKS
jgi:hypothetical protein